MKKLIIIFLSIVLCFGICGCKNNNENSKNNESTDSTSDNTSDTSFPDIYDDLEDYLSWPQFDEPIELPEDEF